MNGVDIVIVIIVALGALNGYRTGFVRQITRLFGAVIAYFLSVWLRPYVAPAIEPFVRQMHVPSAGALGFWLGDWSGVIAFALVFVVTFFLLRFASGLIDALFSLPVLSTLNRLAGLAAGLVLALLFVYVAILVVQYVNAPKLQAALHQSSIVQWMNVESKQLWTSAKVPHADMGGHTGNLT
ncbi:CvpA family protein [Alicyclobacillus cycloheptanicus]|jgi:uncharacterized membrane protein required for colicin V production|uniref:Membrane protein required for colicin V production n=1 Tax=Alicyclobacillus cycloheptanicus TaxID=1457 RepID=A0ABT9XER0_9BACL|nr:CvpA family protein [Alicyclobacillus cycloheptanicus]MDQ0188760.1 putative membrane protein required for colicin V production [Alicyclobacillus cycloheptanicus]WDM00581.1 CvpA family protein [Alicyclobacillus cycloheptanicus]